MVISCSKLGNGGRLGNMLFAIASTLGIAEKTGQKASFPTPWKYAPFFNITLPVHGFGTNQYKEQVFHYDESVYDQRDVDLSGYYQSYKYFPKDFKLTFNQDLTDKWRAHPAFSRETIGIHIRRSDYVGHPMYYQLPITWYLSALLSIKGWQDMNIVIVSDDMDYVKVHFECLPNAHMIKAGEIDHLCMLSLCDHTIVGNSSFAWWGAYLGEQKNVIHSGKMFRGEFEFKDIKDYYPPNWTEHGAEKLNLLDVTFTIPVLYDHPDRKQNFDLSLCMLQSNFWTKVITGEQGGDRFKYSDKYCKYVQFPYENFHRTRMLNEMALMAETDIIVNWDADIFIPPLQIWLAAERLRAGAPVVYPYDGRFARMDRHQWFKQLEKSLDIGITRQFPLFKRNDKESVGGAVMWRKEAFIDAGMENEYMISYAPEDVERWERMHKLGINPQRIDGTLYHMDHFKGSTSSKLNNPFFAESTRLLQTYRAMNLDELRLEIDRWPWRHQYTEAYYNRISEGAIRSAKEVYNCLVENGIIALNNDGSYSPTIIDIGCGVGEWSLGNPNYYGIDHSIPKKALMIPDRNYFDRDLEKVDLINQDTTFDLCLCLEVAEHLSESRADWLIKYLCSLSHLVLFSAAIPNQGGTGHINEQFQTYWADKFYANGFGAEICYPVKDNPNVELWYRQNMILYRRGSKGGVYNFVLPEYYEQITRHLKSVNNH